MTKRERRLLWGWIYVAAWLIMAAIVGFWPTTHTGTRGWMALILLACFRARINYLEAQLFEAGYDPSVTSRLEPYRE